MTIQRDPRYRSNSIIVREVEGTFGDYVSVTGPGINYEFALADERTVLTQADLSDEVSTALAEHGYVCEVT